jgi:hypothetical protein
MQGKKLAYKKSEDSKHTKEKTTHRSLYVQKYDRKKIILLQKNSPIYSTKGQSLKYFQKKKSKTMEEAVSLIPKKSVLNIHI